MCWGFCVFFGVCQDGPLFTEYADLISLDYGMPINSPSDVTQLFQRLCELHSCSNKGSPVKSGRWFSWHGACAEHVSEFFSTRLLLLHRYPDGQPDASSKKFSQLRSDMGGLQLALHCTSWSTWMGVQVLRIVSQPCWNYYSQTVESVKSPRQGLLRTADMTTDLKWMKCNELTGLVDVFWQDSEFDKVLRYHTLSRRHSDEDKHRSSLETFVHQVWYYGISVLSKRSAAYSKLASPPECYAALLVQEGELAEDTEMSLREDFRLLCLAEQSRPAQELVKDLQCTVSAPVRLMFSCYEAGLCSEGKRLLNGMLHCVPDSKFIEDLHGKVKSDALHNPNRKQTPTQVQNVLQNSGLFEARGIPHLCALDKQAFKLRWKRTKTAKRMTAFFARHERVDKGWSRVMSPKTWYSLSEESLARSAAAWSWLRLFVSKNLKQCGIQLNDICQNLTYLLCFYLVLRLW